MEESKIFGKIARPVAEVFLQSKNGLWFQTFMYIDSGADVSLVPRQLGESLGFTFRRREIRHIRGIGERTVPVVIKTARARLGVRRMDIRLAWSLAEDVPLILGRMDVFDSFVVSFDQRNGVVTFKSR